MDLSYLAITLSRNNQIYLTTEKKNPCKLDFENVLLDKSRDWTGERVVITINRPNLVKNDIEVDREILGSTKHFGTKFKIFQVKKSM